MMQETPKNILSKLTEYLNKSGLEVRGGFHQSNETYYLIGHGGSKFWSYFQAAKESHRSVDPLDNWTKELINDFVGEINKREDISAKTVFPSDGPPYAPFQQWIKNAENLAQSPIGMMIHPEYGLWHAYRATIIVAGHNTLPRLQSEKSLNPCETCISKPCLNSCPANAYQAPNSDIIGYDVPKCVSYLKTDNSMECKNKGCHARRQCPVGQSYIYETDHAEFHMHAFLRNK